LLASCVGAMALNATWPIRLAVFSVFSHDNCPGFAQGV